VSIYKTNKISWKDIYYPLCPPSKDKDAAAKPFSSDDEHAEAIDLIITMMKRSNGDIQTPKQPEVMIKGNSLFFYNTRTFAKTIYNMNN
jgi:hypothetical protein